MKKHSQHRHRKRYPKKRSSEALGPLLAPPGLPLGPSWPPLWRSKSSPNPYFGYPLFRKISQESPRGLPGPPRDAFGDDFVLIFRCPEALQCALLRPTCALEIARSKRTCFRPCLHSTAIPNAHLKCFNSSPTIANQQYPSPSKGRAVTPAQPAQ